MLKFMMAAAVAFVLAAAPAAPAFAQANTEKTEKTAASKSAKKLSPQQQKMKNCAAKWGDYKKEKKVKGRAEYNKFMSGCLKG